MPVAELRKPANTKCKHQFSKGCRIYASRPGSCRAWNCQWLVDPSTAHLRRPDKVRYVIDSVPDFPLAVDEVTGQQWNIEVIQIWVDPLEPDAWRKDSRLRDWMLMQKKPVTFRLGNRSAILVTPPTVPANSTGDWMETKITLHRPEVFEWAVEEAYR